MSRQMPSAAASRLPDNLGAGMTRLSAGDGLDIDPSDPQYESHVAEWLGGSYASGWSSLKMAFVGSAVSAAEKAAPVVRQMASALKGGANVAEAKFLSDCNYAFFLLGPCLSTVLFSSFALESFIRLGFQVALELERSDVDRRRGFDEKFNRASSAFDALRANERLDRLCEILDIHRLGSGHPVRRAAEQLIRYRNDCAHDSPVLTLAPRIHRRSAAAHRSERPVRTEEGGYEKLTLSMQPVRFKHVVEAARAHDGVVGYLYGAMQGTDWLSEMRSLDQSLGDGTLASAMPVPLPWSMVERIARDWESLRDSLSAALTGDELRQLGLELRRKTRVKRATDGES